MPTELVFPSDLPGPKAAPLQGAERRGLTPIDPGPFEAVAHERDRRGQQDVTFPAYTDAQMERFEQWWREELVFGGAWFSSYWPMAEGKRVYATRRFLGGVYKAEFISAFGFWRITATFELRGRGLPPLESLSQKIYTSWPYALIVDDAVDLDRAIPLSGQLWRQPIEEINLDRAIPLEGEILLQLQAYDAPEQAFNADRAIPIEGTLLLQLHVYDSPEDAFNSDRAIPLSGTLVVQLVTYDAREQAFNADRAIPLSGTLA